MYHLPEWLEEATTPPYVQERPLLLVAPPAEFGEIGIKLVEERRGPIPPAPYFVCVFLDRSVKGTLVDVFIDGFPVLISEGNL